MMHEGELKDKCALCGKLILETSDSTRSGDHDEDFSPPSNPAIEETIQNTNYKFDTRECATMFKRFIDVYGKEFQPLLGDKQYISDPFWDRVIPREDEVRFFGVQEKTDRTYAGSRKSNGRDIEGQYLQRKSETVSQIQDSFEVQKLIRQVIQSAKSDISLAIPSTATDVFFSPPAQDSTSPSFSCSVFFQLLKDAATTKRDLNVKILTNAEPQKGREKRENGEENDQRLFDLAVGGKKGGKNLSNIQIKHIEQDYSSLNDSMVILVVDRKASLAIELEEKKVELKDPVEKISERERSEIITSRSGPQRIIKLATYSENKSTVLSYISIFESLWKEIELNERITSLLAEIKRRENVERDFINMAAHELRAPIQPVLGLAQILQTKKNVDTKEQEELLSVIIRNARRLNILTENLLDLAKIENNTLNLQKETFNLPELIFEAIADMKSQLSSNQIMINVEYCNSNNNSNNSSSGFSKVNPENVPPIMVEADKTRIMQVISNLLTNAIKFTRGGRVVIRLDDNNGDKGKNDSWNEKGEAREKGIEKNVTVSFIDSGTGIHPEIIGRVFEKFVTKSDKGTGLGLFISKKIIEAHGGRIWAKNNTDAEGATIAFSLPPAANLS